MLKTVDRVSGYVASKILLQNRILGEPRCIGSTLLQCAQHRNRGRWQPGLLSSHVLSEALGRAMYHLFTAEGHESPVLCI